MFRRLQSIGLALRSLQGWWTMAFTMIPFIVTLLAGWFDGLPWAAIIAYSMVALSAGAILVLVGLVLIERASAYFTATAEKRRILTLLNGMIEDGVVEADTPTIASIWANSREVGNIYYVDRFRRIKSAINNGKLVASALNGRQANKNTRVSVAEVKRYFAEKGVIEG